MPFWSAADVEIASRIVTAKTKNERLVRGKLTLHFANAQTQSDADEAADRCAAIAQEVLGEAPDVAHVLDDEARFVSELRRRLPIEVPPLRSIDLAGLHVLGDPSASSAIRRSTSSFRAVTDPSALTSVPQTPPPPPPPVAPTRSSGSTSSFRALGASGQTPAPPSVVPSSRTGAPAKRPTMSRMRALSPNMVLPAGSSPDAIGRMLAPFVRDCAGRLLVGFLRAYDLLVQRGIPLDENSAEMLAAVVPVSDAPHGAYEASRTSELNRWQDSFGQATFLRLRRECQVVAVFLTHSALAEQSIPQNVAFEILQDATSSAFSGEAAILHGMSRWLKLGDADVSPALCAHLTDLVGQGNPTELAAALRLLVASVNEDLAVAAALAREAVGM